MRYLYTALVFMLSFSSGIADDEYIKDMYISATLLYWCTYKEVPTSKDEIAKVTNIFDSEPDIATGLDDWLKSFSYEMNDDVMTIIEKSKTFVGRNNKITQTVKSSSNCRLKRSQLKE